MYKPGDLIILEGTKDFYPGIECIVMEVNEITGRIVKLKAAVFDKRLLTKGFFIENGDLVCYEYNLNYN